MSIVALKRKSNLNASRKDGFSLNGIYRNKGAVGSNSLFSNGGPKMFSKTTVWKGHGGCCGKFNPIPKSTNFSCCNESTNVKRSVKNTKGMITNKYRWKDTSIPDSVFIKEGKEVPNKNQLKLRYNNWVSADSENNLQKSSQVHTNNIKNTIGYCSLDKEESTSCGEKCKGYHLGGKYIYPTPHCKFNNAVKSNDIAILGAIYRRASVTPKGYNKPWPPFYTSSECQNRNLKITNKEVLNNYYKDGNNISIKKCN